MWHRNIEMIVALQDHWMHYFENIFDVEIAVSLLHISCGVIQTLKNIFYSNCVLVIILYICDNVKNILKVKLIQWI